MTREELERRVRMLLPLGSMKRAEAERTADAVIRLVVEACCAVATESRMDFDRHGNHEAAKGCSDVVESLRSTFLPPKDPSNG